MDHTPESLEHYSASQGQKQEKEPYTERPFSHRIMAWLLIAAVLFAFLGACYWIATYGRA